MIQPIPARAVVVVAALSALLAGCGSAPGGTPTVSQTPVSTPTPVSDTTTPQPSVDPGTVGTVEGTVLNPDGTPAVGCAIDKGGGTEEAIVTDASGRFTFTQQQGEWTVRFACSTATDQDARQVTVTNGETVVVNVTLSA